MDIIKTKFISSEGEQNLLNYKYNGSDASLIYKYILSPLAQYCIDHIVPNWMAYLFYSNNNNNRITLI